MTNEERFIKELEEIQKQIKHFEQTSFLYLGATLCYIAFTTIIIVSFIGGR